MKHPNRLAICVATFRRADMLRRLLESLAFLEFPNGQPEELRVIVVDNDPGGSAAEVARSFTANGRAPLTIQYVAEPRRGISHARNTAVATALQLGAETVVFVDDDEIATPGWLDALLEAHRRTGAALVAGPVMPSYPSEVPTWIRLGKFFDRPQFAAGTELPHSGTGNLLVVRDVFDRLGEPFSAAYALSGGEDTHFTIRARLAGYSIVAAPDAIVTEEVPSSRATMQWLVKRAFRSTCSYVRCQKELFPWHGWLPKRIATTIASISYGCVLVIGACVGGGRQCLVHGLRHIAGGAGAVAGMTGFSYSEYQTTHGQ